MGTRRVNFPGALWRAGVAVLGVCGDMCIGTCVREWFPACGHAWSMYVLACVYVGGPVPLGTFFWVCLGSLGRGSPGCPWFVRLCSGAMHFGTSVGLRVEECVCVGRPCVLVQLCAVHLGLWAHGVFGRRGLGEELLPPELGQDLRSHCYCCCCCLGDLSETQVGDSAGGASSAADIWPQEGAGWTEAGHTWTGSSWTQRKKKWAGHQCRSLASVFQRITLMGGGDGHDLASAHWTLSSDLRGQELVP
nr:uncharacterized protein LOC105711950 [Aotus nancymaae]